MWPIKFISALYLVLLYSRFEEYPFGVSSSNGHPEILQSIPSSHNYANKVCGGYC